MSVRQETKREAYDVVVVGSGMGGLAAAAFLAKAGKSVLVVERHDRAGGYAHSFRRGKYHFDAAIHVMSGAFGIPERALHILGVRNRCTFLPIEPFYTALLPDFRLDVRSGSEAFVEAHARRFPHEERGLRELIQLCSTTFQEARAMPIELSFWDALRMPRRFPLLFKYRNATFGQVMDQYLTDARLKAVFTALWVYLGLPPSKAAFPSFASMLTPFIENPTFYCQGGFQNVPNAYVESLHDNGGEILFRQPVRRILVEDGQARGIVLENGQRVRAPVVVSNADATETFVEMVGAEHLPGRYMRHLRGLKPGLSAFAVYLATTLDVAALGITYESILFKHWDHDQTYRDVLAGHPAAITVTIPTLVDPSLAPPGEHVVSVVTLVRYDAAASWREEKAAYAERLLDGIEAALPGLRDHITFAEGASPRTMERYTLNLTGAIYGWASTPQQVGRHRLSQVTPIRGLYLAGQWTQPGAGIVGVTISGIRAAALILGYGSMGELLHALERAPS